MEWINLAKNFLIENISSFLPPVATVIVSVIVYKLFEKEIKTLEKSNKIEPHIAYTLKRLLQWLMLFIVTYILLSQIGVEISSIMEIIALFGSTVVGFAAINTIGNAIAGLIVMVSKPFKIGDRIYFKDKFADIVGIGLIFTKMRTLDNVVVSVPNQELLKTEIDNYGIRKRVRRKCSISTDFEHAPEKIEKILLKAAKKTKYILKAPDPFVRITDFKDYAVEYTLYVFINKIKDLRQIDADLRRNVLKSCRENNIDISTPMLYKEV